MQVHTGQHFCPSVTDLAVMRTTIKRLVAHLTAILPSLQHALPQGHVLLVRLRAVALTFFDLPISHIGLGALVPEPKRRYSDRSQTRHISNKGFVTLVTRKQLVSRYLEPTLPNAEPKKLTSSWPTSREVSGIFTPGILRKRSSVSFLQ